MGEAEETLVKALFSDCESVPVSGRRPHPALRLARPELMNHVSLRQHRACLTKLYPQRPTCRQRKVGQFSVMAQDGKEALAAPPPAALCGGGQL